MIAWTAQDWAILITAIGVALPAVGAFIVQMIMLARQKSNKADTDQQLKQLHDQGNSNLAEAKKLSEALGVERGKTLGITQERANPMSPKP